MSKVSSIVPQRWANKRKEGEELLELLAIAELKYESLLELLPSGNCESLLELLAVENCGSLLELSAVSQSCRVRQQLADQSHAAPLPL